MGPIGDITKTLEAGPTHGLEDSATDDEKPVPLREASSAGTETPGLALAMEARASIVLALVWAWKSSESSPLH